MRRVEAYEQYTAALDDLDQVGGRRDTTEEEFEEITRRYRTTRYRASLLAPDEVKDVSDNLLQYYREAVLPAMSDEKVVGEPTWKNTSTRIVGTLTRFERA